MLTSRLQTGSRERFLWFCSEPQLVSSLCSSERMEGSTEKENNISWFHVLLERSPWWIEFTWSTGVKNLLHSDLTRWWLEDVCPPGYTPTPKPAGCSTAHALWHNWYNEQSQLWTPLVYRMGLRYLFLTSSHDVYLYSPSSIHLYPLPGLQ